MKRTKEDLLKDIKNLTQKIKDLKRKTKELEDGSLQLSTIVNSVLMIVAHDNGGELKIPKDHLNITEGWTFSCQDQDGFYVFKVEEGEE